MKVRKIVNFNFSVLRYTLGTFLRLKYHYKCTRYKLEKNKPYIILSNHTTQMDPLLVGIPFNRGIHYVMLDILLDTKGAKIISFIDNPIAKTKDITDLTTIRNMFEVVKQNEVIGLFPSGDCTIDGNESPISPTIGKLLKKLNAEVILFRTYGLFGMQPRFSKSIRKGKSEGKVVDVIKVEELNTLSSEEIHKRVTDSLYCNQVEENNQLFKSKSRAEYLEKILYACPECYSFFSLESSGNDIRCNKCHFETSYLENLRFKKSLDPNANQLETISEWNSFQKNLALDYVSKFYDPYDSVNNKVIVSDQIKFLEFHKRRKRRSRCIRRFRNGYIQLFTNRIEIYKDMNIINIPLKHATLSYQMRSVLVIYTEEEVYKIFGKDRFNVIKYLHLVEAMKTKGMIL